MSIPHNPPSLLLARHSPDDAGTNPRLVSLRTQNEDDTRPQHQYPFPCHRGLVEDILRKRGDVDDGDEGEDAHDEGAEEDAVLDELCGGEGSAVVVK